MTCFESTVGTVCRPVYESSGPSTLTVGTPVPTRAMIAMAVWSVGLDSRWMTMAGMDEVTGPCIHHGLAAGPELQAHGSGDDVEAGFVLTVVVPARG